MLVLNEIAKTIETSDKPVIQQIYNKEGNKLLAIGLKKGVVFPEHVAPAKAKLMVVQGEVDFNTETQSYRLERFDSFNIPIDVKHTVVGVIDAIFLLLIGKPKVD